MRLTWILVDLKFILIHFLLFYLHSPSSVLAMQDEFLPPNSVTLEAQTDQSLTIAWKEPELSENSPKIVSYSVHYYITPDAEKWETVSEDTRSKYIHNLQPATNYTIYVTAHYSGNKSASSLTCVMSTLERTSNSVYKDCSCFKPGTKSCDKQINNGHCVCHIGYEGSECDTCVKGYYRSGDECKSCPCSLESSFGKCQLGTDVSGEVTCACREGYFGSLCDMCIDGFYPIANGQCVKCICLFCALTGNKNSSCNQCPNNAHNISNHVLVKINCGILGPRGQQRTVDQGDGTVAVVAAVASLAFIACVAAGITCYRRHLQAHNQPPFWSIELTEDKITLSGSNSDYERLGEGSSKQHFRTSHHQRSPSVVEATAAQREANQPQYNCISI